MRPKANGGLTVVKSQNLAMSARGESGHTPLATCLLSEQPVASELFPSKKCRGRRIIGVDFGCRLLLSFTLQRARQLRLVSSAPPVFSLRRRVLLSPSVHGAAVEQIFYNPWVEYVKGDPSRSALQQDRSRSRAREPPVLQPTFLKL